MSIVTRGLGLGSFGSIVAAGAAIAVTIVVLPPELPPADYPSYNPQRPYARPGTVLVKPVGSPVTITVPKAYGDSLIPAIQAKASAYVTLLTQQGDSYSPQIPATGGATAKIIVGVRADSSVGQLIAKGEHDVSDEELLSMVMALLDL